MPDDIASADRRRADQAAAFMTDLLGGEPTRVRDQMAEDICWRPPIAADGRGYSGSITGRDEVLGVFAAIGGAVFEPRPKFTVVHALANGDIAAVLGRLSATVKTGQPYENLYAFHLRFDASGRVAELYEFTDTVFATKSFGQLISGDPLGAAR